MTDASLLWAALATATAGMAVLALTILAHWRQFFGKRALSLFLRLALRGLGALLLVVSFALCAMADPILMAVLVWPTMLTIAAALIAMMLTLHATLRRR